MKRESHTLNRSDENLFHEYLMSVAIRHDIRHTRITTKFHSRLPQLCGSLIRM